jgi:hypothetical protein
MKLMLSAHCWQHLKKGSGLSQTHTFTNDEKPWLPVHVIEQQLKFITKVIATGLSAA